MDRNDPELGPVRRCRRCQEWWPLDGTFYEAFAPGKRLRICNACRVEARPPKPRVRTEGERLTDRRYYQRNAERFRAAARARYARRTAAA